MGFEEEQKLREMLEALAKLFPPTKEQLREDRDFREGWVNMGCRCGRRWKHLSKMPKNKVSIQTTTCEKCETILAVPLASKWMIVGACEPEL